MIKKTHRLIGEFLLKALQENHGIQLDKQSFLYGCILPDLNFSFIVRPHIPEKNAAQMEKRIDELLEHRLTSACFGKLFSRKLGVLCHFYADFFCSAHTRNFGNDVMAHVRYEKRMYDLLSDGRIALKDPGVARFPLEEADAEPICRRFDRLYEAYLKTELSMENDLDHSVKFCMETLVSITVAAATGQTAEPDLLKLA